jgi:photosystem II stability/assembly factor-like uncharacterized protein
MNNFIFILLYTMLKIYKTLVTSLFTLITLTSFAQWSADPNSPAVQFGGVHWDLQLISKDTVLTDIYNASSSQNDGLYRTVNGGQSWQQIYAGGVQTFHFHDYRHGLIKLNNDLYYTSDAGQTWQNILTNNQLGSASISSDSTIYAVIRTQASVPNNAFILKSLDAGLNWDSLFLPQNPVNQINSINNLSLISEDTLVFVARTSSSSYFTYQSNDGGLNWDTNRIHLNIPIGISDRCFEYANDSSFFIVGGFLDTLFKTTDHGQSFQAVFSNGRYIADVDVDGNFAAVACSTNTLDSTVLIARSTNLFSTHSFDTIRNYAQNPSSGMGRIAIIGGNYGWAGSYERLFQIGACNLNAAFTFQDNGGGNYSFTNSSIGNFNESYWAFGDGSTARSRDTSHTFAANGQFVVVLAIQNSSIPGGCFDYFLDTLNVSGVTNSAICQAAFVIYPDSSSSNLNIVNSSIGSNLSYSWDFGDGSPVSNLAFPSHSYTASGPFNLCLTVDDGISCVSTYCDSIQKSGVRFNKSAGFTINVIPNLTTSLDKQGLSKDDINVYPIPTKSLLFIKGSSKDHLYQIISLSGKVILESRLDAKQIDVSALSSGIYLLKLFKEEQAIYKKFIVE